MSLNIAKAKPFEGEPCIHMPTIYGIPLGKESLYHIPVTGERPISICVDGLPDGLTFTDGILSGVVKEEQECTITVSAENRLGTVKKDVLLKVGPEVMLLTPLMGFTTWNAFASDVMQKDVEGVAEQLISTGIREYGYQYVNVDSGWQKEYGGEFDAVMPNEKFPDMGAMCQKLHEKGFKCGIYSTPMRTAWGCPKEFESIPGCTTGEPDILDTNKMGGIGLIHKERNNVQQWEQWGFDYLKYDWHPSDPRNADLMKKELVRSKRAFAFNVSTSGFIVWGDYLCRNCNSWRDNWDSQDNWPNIEHRIGTVDPWKAYSRAGHFYDLDMLEIGPMLMNEGKNRLTDNEQLFTYTLRAFFMSPIQLSCWLDKLTEFEFNMICNDEIIRISQDSLCDYPELMYENQDKKVKVYKRTLENGDKAIAVFNMGDEVLCEHILLEEKQAVKELWTKEELGTVDVIPVSAEPHCVQVFRISK